MTVLWLVRHAMPAHGPDVPAAQWQLSGEGRRAAESLRAVLPSGAVLVASDEPKARQTLEPAGRVLTDRRFREVWRNEAYGGDFRAGRRAYVSGAGRPGWEPQAAAADRFDAGVRYWAARAAARRLVIASHGMAMTLWLSAAIPIADPAGFWAQLRFPDVFVVDLAAKTASRVDSSWLLQVS